MFTVKELFEGYFESFPKELEKAVANDCNLDEENRTLYLRITAENYIKTNIISELKAKVINALKLNGVTVDISFGENCFCVNAAEDIVSEIKAKNAILNGYFNGACYDFADGLVTITLKYGGVDTVNASDFKRHFITAVKERFGIDVNVTVTGDSEGEKIELPDNTQNAVVENLHKSEPIKPEAVKQEKPKKVFSGKPKDGLPVYLESAELFFGEKINTDVSPVKNITPPTEHEQTKFIAAWGEVFGRDISMRTTRSGKKMVSGKFFFSDGTNSLCANIKKFPKSRSQSGAERELQDFMNGLEPLCDGANVIVNGNYQYNVWSNDFVVDVTALATVQKYEETDEHEGEKRVELHCHTNMSAKDAVSKAEDIVAKAHKWGHKAIAITDHGVVQSYPAAAGAVAKIRKKGGEFKVIYGVESYFIDDTRYDISGLNSKEIGKLRNHQIILVKNSVGLKNLYELVSDAHLKCFHGRPITLRSNLDAHREGLIVGSACELGELYRAIVDGKPREELLEIAKYYDYLEIQPLGNNAFMVRDSILPDKTDKKTGAVIPNRFKNVTNLDVIKEFNKTVVSLADELNIPVVATGDVHFLSKEDGIIRQIVMAGQGFDDIENQAPLYLKTTDEMLEDFSYFGERAKEFVIDNPNKIADMVDGDIVPVPTKSYPPVIEGSDDMLKDICWKNAHRIYGENLPEIVEKRLSKELNSIISNGFSIMYISAQKLVAYSEQEGYLVGSRGSVGSSFVATMAGISEVNPLAPHYVCPKCQHSEFFTDGSYGSGFDLPPKNCPDCGTPLDRNGHDIPFETFLGFKGDKVPDIDLNFSDEVQTRVQEYTKTLFGEGNVYKAGTISTIAEKTAFGFAKAYAEKMNVTLSGPELNRLATKVEKAKVKTTTGQHPAGMIIVPDGMSICDFCPVQHPADDTESDIITTHFDFHSIHDTILKLDELGHVVPTIYKYLEEYSGIPVNDITMSDPKIYSLFTSTEALGVTPDEIDAMAGTLGLPEFGTKLTIDMLVDCKPKNFADLLQISGLSHGTNVYHGNAKDLIDNGTCTISEVIGTRDNIMVYLIHQGMEEGLAFKITETVRKGLVAKGKVSEEDWNKFADEMRAVNVPEWYIDSCRKIEYMFPKAHAAAYVISALRIAWYKVYKPLEYYCAYFTARPEDVDVPTITAGLQTVRTVMHNIKAKGKEAEKKELDNYKNLLIFNEMMSRGIEVLPLDINKSHAVKYLPEDGKMRLPFCAMSGCGRKAAFSVYEAAKKGNFISKEDFAIEAGVSKTIIQNLSDLGAFKDLPDTNQISMF
ncbi:MAG: PolC-type DNA polymerase III [Clostridia bacterium]|nr:PolC-type DNA polymerase III [Clostridia bacterium]